MAGHPLGMSSRKPMGGIATGSQPNDHRGFEFIVAFIDSHSALGHSLYITSEYDSTVTISSDYLNLYKVINVEAFKPHTEILDKFFYYLSGMEFSVERKAVHISSTKAISVYATEYGFASGDGFLVIPLEHLTGHYIAVSYEPGQYSTHLMIVGTENSTALSIQLYVRNGTCATAGYTSGSKLQKTIDRFDVIGLKCTGDITGSVVTSDKAVAVLSGNEMASFPVGSSNSDMMIEMMIPVESFGRTYAISNIGNSPSGTTYRIVASQDDTTVTIKGVSPFTLHASYFLDLHGLGNNLLEASAPVIMVMYHNLVVNEVGDSFMAIVPPVTSYFRRPYYGLGGIAYNTYDDVFVTIYFNTSKYPGMTFGIPDIIEAIPGSDVAILTTLVSQVLNSAFEAQVQEVAFVVYVHPKSSVAYGYLGGMAFGFDPCKGVQCPNGGQCLPSGSLYNCLCQPGYTGTVCELETQTATSQPGGIQPTETWSNNLLEFTELTKDVTSTYTTLESSGELISSLQTLIPVESHTYRYTRILDFGQTRIIESGTTILTADLQPTLFVTDNINEASGSCPGQTESIFQCLCTSYKSHEYAVTEEQREDIKEEIEKKLLVDRSNLTRTVQKYKSLEDNRPSAAGIGSGGVAVLVIVASLIVIPDVLAFVKSAIRNITGKAVTKT